MKLDIERLHNVHESMTGGRGQGRTVLLISNAINTALLLKNGQYCIIWCSELRWARYLCSIIGDVAESMNVKFSFDKTKREFTILESGAKIWATSPGPTMGREHKARGLDYVEFFEH